MIKNIKAWEQSFNVSEEAPENVKLVHGSFKELFDAIKNIDVVNQQEADHALRRLKEARNAMLRALAPAPEGKVMRPGPKPQPQPQQAEENVSDQTEQSEPFPSKVMQFHWQNLKDPKKTKFVAQATISSVEEQEKFIRSVMTDENQKQPRGYVPCIVDETSDLFVKTPE